MLAYFYSSQCPEFENEEGFTIIKDGIYHIYLNAELPAGRDNWTYAHEAGHIVLKHHESYEIKKLSERDNWILDREANIFAVNLLMAEEWILHQINRGQTLTASDIGKLKTAFQVSWEAIINRLDELNIQQKSVTHNIFNERRQALQKDLLIEVDENLRYLSCPGCGSRNISSSASYCKICGTYLFNDCTNLGCQIHNEPDARYCERCGAETVLFQAGLLTDRKKSGPATHYDPGEKRRIPELRIAQNEAAKRGGFSAY